MSFTSHKAHKVVIVYVSLALCPTPAYTVRLWLVHQTAFTNN